MIFLLVSLDVESQNSSIFQYRQFRKICNLHIGLFQGQIKFDSFVHILNNINSESVKRT